MTQIEKAKKGEISSEVEKIALDEEVESEKIRELVASGKIVIPRNPLHTQLKKVIGIGKGLRVKVNANIGTAEGLVDIDKELEKLKTAVKFGADTIMDLSSGGPLDEIRQVLLCASEVPFGTVPIYQTAIEVIKTHGDISKMKAKDIFATIENQARQGVDFMTVHCGVTQQTAKTLEKSKRILGAVSRGGTLLIEWMRKKGQENPLYEEFDYLLDIAHEYDITLSLGDGLRPGCILDSSDPAQLEELFILGELCERARERGVQVMVEGPGHVPLNEITANIEIEKKVTQGAPFYVLGPLPTDIASGYDHIVGAIGGTIAAFAGADYLCYVTPKEHLSLPDTEDVRIGVVATKIAAHIADIAKGIPKAIQRDKQASISRANLDWEGVFAQSLDPERAKEYWASVPQSPDKEVFTCTMCGKLCAINLYSQTKKEVDLPRSSKPRR
jgi:phosphomethylpyrimidine synthase